MRNIVLFLLFVTTVVLAEAAPVDVATARRVADAFRQQNRASVGDAVTVSLSSDGIEHLYVFNYGKDEGFVVVPASNAAAPVLAYSTENAFGTELDASVKYWMMRLDAIVGYALDNNIEPDDATLAQWDRLLYGKPKPRKDGAVAAMITTNWNQDIYYNRLCPEEILSRQRVYAGCVAVAMGQIMKYWNYPISGLGSHSYKDANTGMLTADFANTIYDWSHMPARLSGSSSETEVVAVSTLLFHCGVAVDMQYASSGSGSWVANYGNGSLPSAEHALPRYFDYKTTIHSVYRSDYTDGEWTNLLKSELDAARPVIYSGVDGSAGGHAFVCDGYDANGYFHFNWGWSGRCNGYYLLSNVAPALSPMTSPEYTFSDEQTMVIGIEPKDNLRIDTARTTLPAAGGSTFVAVTSSDDNSQSWSASYSSNWLHLSVSQGAGNGRRTRFEVSADENLTGSPRCDTVEIVQGTETLRLFVFQLACYDYEMCRMRVAMEDSENDSWNYATLEFRDLSGASYGHAYMVSGLPSDTAYIGVCPSSVEVVWHAGVWDAECGFTISCSQGSTLLQHSRNTAFDRDILATFDSPCSFCSSCNNTVTLPYHEDFEYGIDCWTTRDRDGDGESWQLTNTLPAQKRHFSVASHSTDGEADNWLISPRISLPGPAYITLAWYAMSAEALEYDIYIGTDTAVANMTELVYHGQATTDYENRMLSLTAYSGQTVYLAFRHHGSDTGTIQIDNISLVATNAPTYHLAVQSSNASRGVASGSGVYEAGRAVTVRATANTGYRFLSWQDGNTDNPRVIYMDSNTTLTASFSTDSLNVVVIPQDSIRGHAWGTGRYAYRSYASLRATPAHGYHFSQWNDGDTNNPRGVRITSDITYTAYFVANTYTVNVMSNDPSQGAVRGSGFYLYGTNIQISATPAQGYTFFRWSDGNNENPRRLTVDDNIDLTAEFALDGFRIYVMSSNESEGSVTGEGVYMNMTTATITATADTGYHFVRWSDGNTSTTRNITVTSDSTFIAYFAIDVYTVKVLTDNAAQGSVRGSGAYEYSKPVTITAVPAPGYHFVRWQDGDTTNPRTFMAEESLNFTAFFAANDYTVTLLVNSATMGTVSGEGVYGYGSTVSIAAIPLQGFRFVRWSNGATDNPYRFALMCDTTFTAVFDTIPTSAIGGVNLSQVSITTKGMNLVVEGGEGQQISVCDLIGRVVYSARLTDYQQQITLPRKGLYVVVINNRYHSKHHVW
ncbi:MAG: C10 family peptidase [Bacteroidales bacterium]|nr:C10 family peptidase [Bacteroidales bacterium]